MPLSAVTGRAELMDTVPAGGLGGTYAGNPVACAAALGVLETIEREQLVRKAQEIEAAVLRRHCEEVGRDPDEVAVTVLDLPVVGRDRDDVWERVERLRGRTAAATYARRHHAGTPAEHRERYARLAEQGVSTVFVALPDLARPEDVLAVAGMLP